MLAIQERRLPTGTDPTEVTIVMEPLTYTVSEVAELLGISRSNAYDLVAEGVLPIVPLPGRRKLVPRVALERLLEAPVLRVAPARHQHVPRDASRRRHDSNDTLGGPRSADRFLAGGAIP
jgi:excisionase family DNA binding protein